MGGGRDILAITGIGGMGVACARRLAQGRLLALFDIDADKLAREADALSAAGHEVITHHGDVAARADVEAFAQRIADAGTLGALVHTAGISGSMAPSERIFDVNLVGTGHMLDVFETAVAPGGAAVFIASMGRISVEVDPAIQRQLAHAETDELKAIIMGVRRYAPIEAYCVSKLGNYLRVAARSLRWGAHGLRVNTISPGIIATPMGALEAANVPAMAIMRKIAPIQRIGQPEDIAAAAEFLLGPNASFITGTDLAVDGGVIAAQTFGAEQAF